MIVEIRVSFARWLRVIEASGSGVCCGPWLDVCVVWLKIICFVSDIYVDVLSLRSRGRAAFDVATAIGVATATVAMSGRGKAPCFCLGMRKITHIVVFCDRRRPIVWHGSVVARRRIPRRRMPACCLWCGVAGCANVVSLRGVARIW